MSLHTIMVPRGLAPEGLVEPAFLGASVSLSAMNILTGAVLWRDLRPVNFSTLVVALAFQTRILGGEGHWDALYPGSIGQKGLGGFQIGLKWIRLFDPSAHSVIVRNLFKK